MPPKGAKKCFVSFLDSHFGAHLAGVLVKQGYDVTGIVRDPGNSHMVPAGVKKVLRRGDSELIRRGLVEADYVVYHTPDSVDDSIKALRILSANHYETEKRMVLVSSVMSWYETPALQDPAPPEDPEEPPELEPLTEDQYNRRVPHIKYQAWRDVEKLCCSLTTDRLKTFVVFGGLMYGAGESRLHALFRQAWTLAPEGLPIYGNGNQTVPMIHTADCATFVRRILTAEEIPESRYFFAVDEGNCTWKSAVTALSNTLGNGRCFKVPPSEFGLHDGIEHFVVNLKVEAAQIQSLMADDADWVAKSGFVENIETVAKEFREARGVTPLRVLVLGPPSAGKSFAARELAAHFKLPAFNIADVIAEYRYQEVELSEEILRLKAAKVAAKREEKLEEKRQAALEELRAKQQEAADAAQEAGTSAPAPNLEDEDDIDEEELVEVSLTKEEADEAQQAGEEEAEGDEATQAVVDKLAEIRRVLAMKQKPATAEAVEPPNPKDKKKAAPKPAKKAPTEPVDAKPDPGKDRLSDRALGIMLRWKLTRTECRNQGWVLDGYPKTIRQARLAFEDGTLEVPEDPEEAEPPMEEEKPYADALIPEFVIHARASDTFLLERLLKTQQEHPHNTPGDFQRRLEAYKNNYEVPLGVVQHLESARSVAGKAAHVKAFDMEAAPLVPPPPPKSAHQARPVDPTVQRIIEYIGKPRNFGATPEDAQQEAERNRLLQAELRAEADLEKQAACDREAADVQAAEQSRTAEAARVRAMKDAERAMLEQRKGPLKQYLMENVIPVLTKGLIEVCNARPEDPVDFLAEWLFRHNPEDHPELYA